MAPQSPSIPSNAALVPTGNFELQLRGDPSAKVADAGKLSELVHRYGGNLKAEPLYADNGKLAGYAVWGVKEKPGLLSRLKHFLGLDTRRHTAVEAFAQALENRYGGQVDSRRLGHITNLVKAHFEVSPEHADLVLNALNEHARSNSQAGRVPPHYAPNVMRGPPPAYNEKALRYNPQDHRGPPPFNPVSSRHVPEEPLGASPVQMSPQRQHQIMSARHHQQPQPNQRSAGSYYSADLDPMTTQSLVDTGAAIANVAADNPEATESVFRVAAGLIGGLFELAREFQVD